MSVEDLIRLIAPIAEACAGKPVDRALAAMLNETFPADGPAFAAIDALCRAGIRSGWLCDREAGGIRFSRPAKPSPVTHDFSIDVVTYADLAGPRHAHPTGEIDMIMPVAPEAQFDGHGRGWLVYPPGSSHRPTVTRGEAVILYLLPQGKIEFSKA